MGDLLLHKQINSYQGQHTGPSFSPLVSIRMDKVNLSLKVFLVKNRQNRKYVLVRLIKSLALSSFEKHEYQGERLLLVLYR